MALQMWAAAAGIGTEIVTGTAVIARSDESGNGSGIRPETRTGIRSAVAGVAREQTAIRTEIEIGVEGAAGAEAGIGLSGRRRRSDDVSVAAAAGAAVAVETGETGNEAASAVVAEVGGGRRKRKAGDDLWA